MNIIELISANYATLTNKQKHIADYLLAHSADVCYLSLKDLSKKTDCTEVTILNLIKKLKINSYLNFKEKFRQYNKGLIEKISTSTYEIPLKKSSKKSSATLEILQEIYQLEVQKLSTFPQTTQLEEIIAMAKMFIGKKIVYIFAHDASLYNASILKNRLELLSLNVNIVDLSYMNDIQKALKNLDKKDLAVFFAFPNYYYGLESVGKRVAEKKCPILLFTDTKEMEMAPLATKTLIADTRTKVFKNSMVLPILSIYLISSALALLLHPDSKKNPFSNDDFRVK